MDSAIRTAKANQLPVRVIINDGRIRDIEHNDPTPSTVERRLLDPIPWSVAAYDPSTGQSVLVRGATPSSYVDQFELRDVLEVPVQVREVIGQTFVRSPIVRQLVLERAKGLCEYCGNEAFRLADGRRFLETHHVVPFSEHGTDSEANVIGLCPNHHREAHFGADNREMRNCFSRESMLSLGGDPKDRWRGSSVH